jgi:hypothetical protein
MRGWLGGWPAQVVVFAAVAGIAFWRDASSAGYVFIGGGVVRALDGIDRDHQNRQAARAAQERDWSETRRLLYASLVAMSVGETGNAEIAGTVANALAHHSKTLSMRAAEEFAISTMYGSVNPLVDADMDLVRAEIRRLTDLLGDQPPPDEL